MGWAWAHRELKPEALPFDFASRAGFLAKSARNGAPSLVEGWVANGFRGRALTVGEVGALSDLDDIAVRIADVAAYLAVLGDRFCDELGSSTFP